MKPRLKTLSALVICTTLVLVFAPGDARALGNGLALTPPMGWNSWNTFGMKINEDLVKGVADVMIAKGFKDAGYEYVVIDDGWQVMECCANANVSPFQMPESQARVNHSLFCFGVFFRMFRLFRGDRHIPLTEANRREA